MTRWKVAAIAALALAGCGAERGGVSKVEPTALQGASSVATTAAVDDESRAPAAPPQASVAVDGETPAAAAPEEAPAADDRGEELIRAFVELDREGAPVAELERYLAAHPELRTAEARPYGRPLMWALEFEQKKAALVLLRAGANVERANPRESSPLHLAARGGLDEVVRELLARGASLKAEDYWGTPLHFAAKYGHTSTMRLLLAAGADPSPHAQDHRFTPLHAAVIERRAEAVRLLIRAKADLNAQDDDGRTPLHWGGYAYTPQPVHRYAEMGKPHDTTYRDPGPAVAMKLLLDAGAQIEATDGRGNTPLHAAAEVGSKRGVVMLLSHGARRSARNHAGQTAADIAAERGDDAIARLLRGRP